MQAPVAPRSRLEFVKDKIREDFKVNFSETRPVSTLDILDYRVDEALLKGNMVSEFSLYKHGVENGMNLTADFWSASTS